jgi:hypothetical protein
MVDLVKNAPQLPVVLASLLLWGSFAWGLPAGVPASEGEAEVAPDDPWARVRLSDAYDYAKCRRCGYKNEVRRPACYRCGYSLPQPSGEYTYPPWVFVPGKGYYREGALVESGKIRTPMFITGLALMGGGAALVAFGAPITASDGFPSGLVMFGIPGLCAMGVGVALVIVATRTKPPVYAFECGELYEPYDAAYARRSRDSEGEGLKIEVTLLGF